MNCEICNQPKILICGDGCDAGADRICKDHPCEHFTPEEANKLWNLLHPPIQPNEWFKHAQQIDSVRWKK